MMDVWNYAYCHNNALIQPITKIDRIKRVLNNKKPTFHEVLRNEMRKEYEKQASITGGPGEHSRYWIG